MKGLKSIYLISYLIKNIYPNNLVTSSINDLNQIEQNLKTVYNSQSKITYSSSTTYDY